MKKFKVAIIGIDTTHSVEFVKLMQGENIEPNLKINELEAVTCLSFLTPFITHETLKTREQQLIDMGVAITSNFDEAVNNCDVILLEINDPTLHLEYFRKCANLGKPIFLDKPFADSVENSRKIIEIAKMYKTKFFTSSSLRFSYDLQNILKKEIIAKNVLVYGPVVDNGLISPIIWYGIHSFEILQRILGIGAVSVNTFSTKDGYLSVIEYSDDRKGIIELTKNKFIFGGIIQDEKCNSKIFKDEKIKPYYYMLLLEILKFAKNETQGVNIKDSFEVMAMVEAANKSLRSGKKEFVETL